MIGKIILAFVLYCLFIMVRGMWRTYKILKRNGQFDPSKKYGQKYARKNSEDVIEADYKIIK